MLYPFGTRNLMRYPFYHKFMRNTLRITRTIAWYYSRPCVIGAHIVYQLINYAINRRRNVKHNLRLSDAMCRHWSCSTLFHVMAITWVNSALSSMRSLETRFMEILFEINKQHSMKIVLKNLICKMSLTLPWTSCVNILCFIGGIGIIV